MCTVYINVFQAGWYQTFKFRGPPFGPTHMQMLNRKKEQIHTLSGHTVVKAMASGRPKGGLFSQQMNTGRKTYDGH